MPIYVNIGWLVLDGKVILTEYCFHFTRDKTSQLSLEFRCSGTRNKFWKDGLPRKSSCSSEHVNLTRHCQYLPVMSWRHYFKVGLSPSKKRHLKMMKNAFYFILKVFFVLKIFLTFCSCLIRMIRFISKLMTSQRG